MNRKSDFLHWSAAIATVILVIETVHLVKTNIHHDKHCIMSKFAVLSMSIFLGAVFYRHFIKKKK